MASAQARVQGGNNSQASKRAAKMALSAHSLNELLNFTLPPRQQPQAAPRRSKKTGTQQGVWNKEKFLNAQYRFIMNPHGDYTVHFADPDIFFQWQDILQVIVPRASALAAAGAIPEDREGHTTCPICLSPPTAARMTKCGHVFCFPCILHYFTTSEHKRWARCPICFDSVQQHQLKAVKWFDGPAGSDLAEGGSGEPQLGFRLMHREPMSTLALPRSPTWPSGALPPHQAPFHFMPDVLAFARFMLATPDSLVADLTAELDELAAERSTLNQIGDELGVAFVDAAELRVREQINSAAALETIALNEAVARAKCDVELLTARAARAAEHGSSPDEEDVPDLPGARTPRIRRNLNPPPPGEGSYLFYQATSGAPLFLHPLDIRALRAHFGSYTALPDTLFLKVEAADAGGVDDALRKRFRYLAHYPSGADVGFIEADLAGFLPAEALKPFEGALRARKARRREKTRKDERARVKAEERAREQAMADVAVSGSHQPQRILLGAADAEQDTERGEEGDCAASAPAPTGAWGAMSFAGVLHASAPTPQPRRQAQEEHDEEFDGAWHELEQRVAGGGGRRGRQTRLILLGGSGGQHARRRR